MRSQNESRYNSPMTSQAPSLSIVIPALDEAETLPLLLQDLAKQENIYIETIVVDGGSKDNTRDICDNSPYKQTINLKILSTRQGRAHQMNEGVKICATTDYLFLHADTRIKNSRLLSNAQRFIINTREQGRALNVAGHFPIKFDSKQATEKYYFYESKTHLNRPDCINGDQGFWISKAYFEQLGGYDESLPYMEDARLALKIFETGHWVTLPGEIETSARRFELEGFSQRQILNSFLCNFNAMGVSQFFQSALDAYKSQNETEKLKLKPFLKLAHQQMNGDGFTTAIKRWYLTGAYIVKNSWQLAFLLDCKRNRKQGYPPGSQNTRRLDFFDQHIAPATEWPIIKALTAILTIFWFYSLFLTQ